jgi:DNA repair exonuclease SbcCD nuclease subunit
MSKKIPKVKPKITILTIGDPHFQVTNIPDVELFIDKVRTVALLHNPTLIICLGDLLHDHEKLHTTPLNFAYAFIHAMRAIAPTVVLVGNHDYINNQQFLTENHWMNGMKEWGSPHSGGAPYQVTIADKVLHQTINGNHFVFCPYVPVGRFKEALNTSETDWTNATIIFAHQEFYNCNMGATVSLTGDTWDEENPMVISGHIHICQKLQSNVYYPGSSMQQSFGEADRKIVTFVTITNGASRPLIELEEINLKLPRKENIKLDIDDLDEWNIPDTNDQLKLTIEGTYDSFKTLKKTPKYKELISKGIKIALKPTKIDRENRLPDACKCDSNFHSILSELVTCEQDGYLNQVYELVAHSREIEVEDVRYV